MLSAHHENLAYNKVLLGELRVDADGQVWRVVDRKGNPCSPRPAGTLSKHGYVRFGFTVNNKWINTFVHRLVWRCFRGEINGGLQINHIDGNKSNNHIENLELVTPKENTAHSVNFIKTHPCVNFKGSEHPRAKLNDSDVLMIRSMRADGFRYSEIAKRFNVSADNVSLICRNKTWSHIGEIHG